MMIDNPEFFHSNEGQIMIATIKVFIIAVKQIYNCPDLHGGHHVGKSRIPSYTFSQAI